MLQFHLQFVVGVGHTPGCSSPRPGRTPLPSISQLSNFNSNGPIARSQFLNFSPIVWDQVPNFKCPISQFVGPSAHCPISNFSLGGCGGSLARRAVVALPPPSSRCCRRSPPPFFPSGRSYTPVRSAQRLLRPIVLRPLSAGCTQLLPLYLARPARYTPGFVAHRPVPAHNHNRNQPLLSTIIPPASFGVASAALSRAAAVEHRGVGP